MIHVALTIFHRNQTGMKRIAVIYANKHLFMQMSDPIDVIISVMKRSINPFQFNSYTVSLGSFLC